jgi:two-component system response regulator HydG
VRGGLPDNALALPPSEMSLPDILEDLERQLIQRAYDKSGGVKTETARLLGIKTSALYYKLEKYGIGTIESRSEKGGAEAEAEALLSDGPPAEAGDGRRGR